MSFTVWQSKDTVYIIDGHHRYKVLDLLEKEGVNVPDKLPCTFIECKDKKEASKLVLTYSSIYAKVQEEGLYEFLNVNDFDFEGLKAEIDIPNIDFEKFELGYFKEQDEEKLNDVPELQEKAISKLGDLFLIDGKHRVLCGDSTKEENVNLLMDGKKADVMITDPPYGMFLDTDFSSMKNNLKFMQKKGIMNGKKYKKVIGDNEDFKSELIETVFNNFGYCKEIFLFGADYYTEYLTDKNKGAWIVWDKRLDESADKMYGSCFELIWSKEKHKRGIARIKWAGTFGTGKEPDHKRFHPNQKPVNLIKWILEYYSLLTKKILVDLYLGVGSTLIACEQTNRICYGIELDEHYIDVILRRYKKLYPDAKFECLNRKFDFKELFKAVS